MISPDGAGDVSTQENVWRPAVQPGKQRQVLQLRQQTSRHYEEHWKGALTLCFVFDTFVKRILFEKAAKLQPILFVM